VHYIKYIKPIYVYVFKASIFGLFSMLLDVSSIKVKCWFKTDEMARATYFAKFSKLVLFLVFY